MRTNLRLEMYITVLFVQSNARICSIKYLFSYFIESPINIYIYIYIYVDRCNIDIEFTQLYIYIMMECILHVPAQHVSFASFRVFLIRSKKVPRIWHVLYKKYFLGNYMEICYERFVFVMKNNNIFWCR